MRGLDADANLGQIGWKERERSRIIRTKERNRWKSKLCTNVGRNQTERCTRWRQLKSGEIEEEKLDVFEAFVTLMYMGASSRNGPPSAHDIL